MKENMELIKKVCTDILKRKIELLKSSENLREAYDIMVTWPNDDDAVVIMELKQLSYKYDQVVNATELYNNHLNTFMKNIK